MSFQFSIDISNQLQTRQISLAGAEILQCHHSMAELTPLLNFFLSAKYKIKSKFSFNHITTETIKRIINNLGIKKTSSGKIPTYFLKKCDSLLNTDTVCVNDTLKTETFPDGLKSANVRPIYKNLDPFDTNQGVYYHSY